MAVKPVVMRAAKAAAPIVDTELLRTFVTVAELRSFTQAAHTLGLTQPAVSGHIKRLQTQLGAELLSKDVPGVQLTPAGATVLEHARVILGENENLLAALRSMAAAGRSIRIGVSHELRWLLGPVLSQMHAEFPQSDFDVHRDLPDQLLDRYDRGHFDICVVVSPHENHHLARDDRTLSQWDDQLAWAASPGAEPRAEEPVNVILAPKGCVCRDIMLSALQGAGRRYRVVLAADTIETAIEAAQRGLGVIALLPANLQPPLRSLGADSGLPPLNKRYVWTVLSRPGPRPIEIDRMAQFFARAIAPQGAAK